MEEVHVQYNTKEDREALGELLKNYPHVEFNKWDDSKIAEATQILEMFLVAGVGIETASRKIVELYSPLRVTKQLEKLRYKGLAVGSTFDLRPNRNGDSYDLTKPEDKAKVRSIVRTE